MLKLLKTLLTGVDAPLLNTPTSYPGAMAEMVEYLILLQTPRSSSGRGKNAVLLQLATTLSKDPYCLGYVTGMFECLCHQWEVPPGEHRVVMGSATTLLVRDLLDSCGDPRSTTHIEDAVFNGALAFAGDPAFQRGKFDGCSELTRYAATKEQTDLPEGLHQRLVELMASTCC
ncbi:MAG TPA: hypothetical protein VGE12_06780 [Noviherbaspirillum sp.]